MVILAPGESEDDLVELRLTFAEHEVPVDKRWSMASLSVFAIPLAGDLAETRSVPLARLSWGDVVRVRGRRHVGDVVSRSGHRTLRLLFSDDDIESTLEAVRSVGGRPEQFAQRMYLIDVPPSAQASLITDALARAANVRSEFSDEADDLIAEAWREALRDNGGMKRSIRLASPRTLLFGLLIGFAVVAALDLWELWGALGVAAVLIVLIARAQLRRRRGGPG
jgi:Domain of unknown function (DUF4265)